MYNFPLTPMMKTSIKAVFDLENDDRFKDIKIREKVIEASIGYILGVYDFYDMRDILKNDFEWKEILNLKQNISESFLTAVCFKQAVYYLIERNIHEPAKVKQFMIRAGLHKKDAKNYMMLESLGLLDLCEEKLKTAVEDFLPPEKVRSLCAEYVAKLDVYIIKFVKRKLRFFLKANSMAEEDIRNDLKMKAVQAFYRDLSFKEPLHLFNSMKQAIHNEGINIIKFYTTKKRGKIVSNEKGESENNTQSINQQNSDGNEVLIQVRTEEITEDKLLLNITFKSICDEFHGKEKKVVKLLSQEYSGERFVRFCAKETGRNFSTLDGVYKFANQNPKEYKEIVRKYVKMDKIDFNDFLEELEDLLA